MGGRRTTLSPSRMNAAAVLVLLLLGQAQLALAYVVKIGLTAEAIGRQRWDQVVTPQTSPFCEYDWIYNLEKSRCNHIYEQSLVCML